jgi:hypothetical protein
MTVAFAALHQRFRYRREDTRLHVLAFSREQPGLYDAFSGTDIAARGLAGFARDCPAVVLSAIFMNRIPASGSIPRSVARS